MFTNKLRGLFVPLFAAFLCALFSGTVYAREVKVFFNGNEVRYDVPAQLVSDRTMVPLSQTFEALVGAGTDYNPATKTSTFRANGHVNTHTIGTNIVFIDGSPVAYDTPSVVIGDRALVPIRMITDTSGLIARWDDINYHVLITSPQVQATPVPATPQPQLPVSITDAASSKNAITPGESVTLTIKTSKTAANVWVNDGATTFEAIYAWEDANGMKTWVANYKPSKTASLTVYANTSRQEAGAVTRSLQITVNAPVATATPTPAPSNASGIILSVISNRTAINPGESIVLTIKTTSAANNVWVDYNNGAPMYSYNPTLDFNGDRTWTVTIAPNATQYLRIWANATQTTQNASTVTQYIEVYGTSSTSNGLIQSAVPNKTTINPNEAVTMTVKTANAANFLWVEYNGTISAINTTPSVDSVGNKTWTFQIYPNTTQQIRVLANSSQTTSNASAVTQTITVSGTGSTAISISNVNANPTTINSGSQYTTITATTNSAAMYVWTDIGTGLIQLSQTGSPDQYGNKYWSAQIYPTTSRAIPIYAGRTLGVADVTNNNIYVTVDNQNPVIFDKSASPGYVLTDPLAMVSNRYTITTNSIVSRVEVYYNGRRADSSSYSVTSDNKKIWQIDIILSRATSDPTTGYVYPTITAYTSAGRTAIDNTLAIQINP